MYQSIKIGCWRSRDVAVIDSGEGYVWAFLSVGVAWRPGIARGHQQALS